MRCKSMVAVAIVMGMMMGVGVMPGSAHAKCKNFEGYHNGTNMFHETGSQGAAINHLLSQIELWKRDTGIQKVRMGKVKTHCGKPFIKYLLTHVRCTAKARVCY